MKAIRDHKRQLASNQQAKKNAEWWVFGHGINDIAVGLGGFTNPLAVFSGAHLLEAILGPEAASTNKRDRSSSLSTDSERRTRPRLGDEDQVGRTGPAATNEDEDDMLPNFGDDTIEHGRDAPPDLANYFSQMPWNISSRPPSRQHSRTGSIAPFPQGLSSTGGFPTSAVGLPGSSHVPIPFPRQGSRMSSMSPLVGRGADVGGSIDLAVHDDDGMHALLASDNPALQDFSFQLHDPAATVDTQNATQNQLVTAALDAESSKFLVIVRTTIEDKVKAIGAEEFERTEVIFQEILPPNRHTKTVAAQAFYHVLALASKGLLAPRQGEIGGLLILSI